ncbi:MAG: hypothetical protein H6739_27820 [Alphaproteobacteria bacterium]|nr:hypothetical protein [Alphaproteobacteria bacterium]
MTGDNGRDSEDLGVIAYDADQPLFGKEDAQDVTMLWGRIVHHLLMFDYVMLTDSAMATNVGLLCLVRDGRLRPLLEAGALRVAHRDGVRFEELYRQLSQTSDAPWVAYEAQALEVDRILDFVCPEARMVFSRDQVSHLYSREVRAFLTRHEGGEWALGRRRLTDQFNQIAAIGLGKSRDGLINRRDFYIWDPAYQKAGTLMEVDEPVQRFMTAGLSAPYSKTVAQFFASQGLKVGPWLSPTGTRNMTEARALNDRQDVLVEGERLLGGELGDSPGLHGLALRTLSNQIGWLIAPTNQDYRDLGRLIATPDLVLRVRGTTAFRARRSGHLSPQSFNPDGLLGLAETVKGLLAEHQESAPLGAGDDVIEIVFMEDRFLVRSGDVRVRDDVARQLELFTTGGHLVSHQTERPEEAEERARRSRSPSNRDALVAALQARRGQPDSMLAAPVPADGLRIYAEHPSG